MRIVRDGEYEPATHPCAPRFRPPPGRYTTWIETRDSISREDVRVEQSETSGQQEILTPLVPAARVKIPAEGLDEGLRVTVLRLSEPFRRDLSVRAALKEPIAVQPGRFLVVVFNRRGEVVHISRPFVATARSMAAADLQPGAKADLVALLSAPSEREAALAVDERAADLLVPNGEQSLAVWYDLEPGAGRLSVRSPKLFMEPQDIHLRARSLSTARADVRVRPTLTIRIDASEKDLERLAKAKATLLVRPEGGDGVLKQNAIETSLTHRFEFMPPEVLDAAIEIGSWKIRQRVDLTAGIDTEVTFAVESIEVAGVVTHGGERAPARLQFRRDDEAMNVETDTAGRYELVLWQPGRFVSEVWLRNRPEAPSHQDFVRIDGDTTTLDFRIPRTHYRVRVIDDDTGRPIARSMVTSFNTWIDANEGQRRIGRPVFTDAEGFAELPPFRAGEVEVHAAAEGYFDGGPLRFNVSGETTNGGPALDFRLEPMGKGSRVRVFLPNGSAASGARLLTFAGGNPSRVLWQGATDAAGVVEIPDVVEGSVLLIRHAGAGSLVRRWSRLQAEPMTLPPAAAPVVVKAIRTDQKPARFARITAWINGVPIAAAALTWLTDESPATDRDGVWIGRNLPAASIRLTATAARSPGPEPAALEALAKPINYPWPSTVTLSAIE